MSIEIQKNLFTYKDISQIVNRLLKLDKELDEMLSVYQTNDRRGEIEEIRVYCNPVYLLQGLLACLYFEDEDDPVEVSSDMRSIALEDEFYKCETTDWLIDSLAGKPNPNPYANKPHPWTNIDELKKYPEEIYFCIESVMSSYFTLTGIEEDRREVWNFWSSHTEESSPKIEDKKKWENMERAYFNCQEKRKDFLNNLLSAIRNPKNELDNDSQELEGQESSNYGFVYFIRNKDLYKIGITENLLRRLGELNPDEILNVSRCSNFKFVEKEIHDSYKAKRLPQTEYFRLDENEVEEVNKLLTQLSEF